MLPVIRYNSSAVRIGVINIDRDSALLFDRRNSSPDVHDTAFVYAVTFLRSGQKMDTVDRKVFFVCFRSVASLPPFQVS